MWQLVLIFLTHNSKKNFNFFIFFLVSKSYGRGVISFLVCISVTRFCRGGRVVKWSFNFRAESELLVPPCTTLQANIPLDTQHTKWVTRLYHTTQCNNVIERYYNDSGCYEHSNTKRYLHFRVDMLVLSCSTPQLNMSSDTQHPI